ncbi:MAG: pentapeptide repeat-containing protein [Cyanobacteria bacterium P01_F01_bin.143]
MSLSDQQRAACREIANRLKQADIQAGKTPDPDYFYDAVAQKRIKSFRWYLFLLNRPFVWLRRRMIEPLDFKSYQAKFFKFFAKVSPVLEVLGVVAIPFVLFYYENKREDRQIAFEQKVITSQAEVSQQQAVRAYLSQITTIYLDVEDRENIRQDTDFRKLLATNTIAIFDELSINESFQDNLEDGDELREKLLRSDRKGDVINFLYQLDWISGNDPLLSMRGANLSQANLGIFELNNVNLSNTDLSSAYLYGADLNDADLSEAILSNANLRNTELKNIDLSGAQLGGADLNRAFLKGANLRGAYLSGADFSRANLSGADLRGALLSDAVFCKTIMEDGKTKNNSGCEESEK